MSTMRCVLVTDHANHRHFDSVYLLARHLNAMAHVEALVVSLGDAFNQQSLEQQGGRFRAVQPDPDFCFENRHQYFKQRWQDISTASVDFVLIRLIPFDTLRLLQLEQCFNTAHFINTPKGIIKTESKAFLSQLSAHTPFIEECSSIEQLQALRKQRPLVLKPLYGYGGEDNILLGPDYCVYQGERQPQARVFEHLAPRFEQGESWLAMEYLPNAHKGDRRILVVNSQIIGASLRLPSGDAWICNVSSGGCSVATQISEREMAMIEDITPVLAREGIQVFGTDTLLNQNGERVLSEINTLCIGGFYTQHYVLNNPQVIEKAVNGIYHIMLGQLELRAAG